ncbi:MAG: 2-oxoacid:acceptor oxidoreductase family protein [bacterium]|nr:MAG: 2-oxoacid:acceptor oxidoreductase family protein [bacterium]
MEYNIVAAGVGGQGIVLFSEILSKAMLLEGMNASFYVHSGLAQLGGSVRSHIRSGNRICPKISEGCADVILSLEMAEILHAVPYLKMGGTVLISEVVRMPYHSAMEPSRYPSREALERLFVDGGTRATFVPADGIALGVGHIQTVNVVMLGALVASSGVVETESLVTILRSCMDRNADINVEAFWKGYEFIKGRDWQ